MFNFVKTILDYTPAVGYVKAGVHKLAGDDAAAKKSWDRANKSTGVVLAIVAGAMVEDQESWNEDCYQTWSSGIEYPGQNDD